MAVLLTDIGGTKARFCWLKNKKLDKYMEYRCEGFKTLYQVINKFIKDFPEPFDEIILAGAGPVVKGKICWTNCPTWKTSEKELSKKYHLKKVILLNDVQAQGEGLKTLYKCEKTTILMTAGTGLGSCFIINGKVIPGEIGQVRTENSKKIEDTISGPGIVKLYHSFGGNKKIKSATEIDNLRKDKDKIAQLTYKTFYQKWGEVSADLVTALYAQGGIYLWGGLIPKNKADEKVLFTAYKKNLPFVFKKIPLCLVKDKMLAFKGLRFLSNHESD